MPAALIPIAASVAGSLVSSAMSDDGGGGDGSNAPTSTSAPSIPQPYIMQMPAYMPQADNTMTAMALASLFGVQPSVNKPEFNLESSLYPFLDNNNMNLLSSTIGGSGNNLINELLNRR